MAVLNFHIRVGAPLTDHLRYYGPHLVKFWAVQVLPVSEDRNQEDCNFSDDFIPYIEIIVKF